jgi:hypothetical protein
MGHDTRAPGGPVKYTLQRESGKSPGVFPLTMPKNTPIALDKTARFKMMLFQIRMDDEGYRCGNRKGTGRRVPAVYR